MSMPDVCSGYHPDILTAPNLALSSIAGNLDKKHNVKIADLVLRRKNVKKAVLEALRKTKPDILGLSAITFQYNSAVRIAKFIKNWDSGIKIALGGYHATLMYQEIADSKDSEYFDFIFRGESDLSFNETINKLEKGENLKTVSGLSYKEKGKFIHNNERELEDLSHIKLPNRDVRLWKDYNVLKVPFDLIEFSRGCLMSCNFCIIRKMYGKSFRTYETERVMQDIKNAKRLGTRVIFFVDDNITTDIDKFGNLCDEIVNNGHNDLLYAVQSSSLGISSSEQLVKKMAKAGFKLVFLGMENASKENLMRLKKGNIVNNTVRAVQYLKENGILISGGFIIGTPEDDYNSIEDTFKFASDLKVDFIAVQILVPYPKTEIRDELMESGLITNKENYRLYNTGVSNIRTKYLNDEDLTFIRYKLLKKYFKTRKVNILRAFKKDIRVSLRFLMGVIKFLPGIFSLLFNEKIKRLFLSEKHIFNYSLKKESKLNTFKI